MLVPQNNAVTRQFCFQLKALAASHPEDADSFTSAISNAEENVEWSEKKILSISTWLQTRLESSSKKTNLSVICAVFVCLFKIVMQ